MHYFYIKNQFIVSNIPFLFQIDATTGQIDSYESLLKRCVRAAISMRLLGLSPDDDIVAICSNNHINACVPFIASLFLGIKVCSYDPMLSSAHTTHLLKLIQPKIMFVIPDSKEMIEEAARDAAVEFDIVVFDTTLGSFSDFLTEQDGEDDFSPVEVDDIQKTAVIFFSSGTTGLPKGICLGHAALIISGGLWR